MHQCFFYFHTGLIHRTKIVLANSAKWTNPIFWKIFKCCTWLYAILWVADSWVILPTADITYVFLHSHIVLIVICCKYTHYTSNDKAKRVEVVLIYNNYNSVCYLWETLLSKKLLCVPWVLWEYSSPTDYTDSHRWLVALVRPRNPQNSQKFGCVSGCVGTAGCHTLLHLCKSVLSVGDPSLQEASVGSVNPCYLWETLLYKKLLWVPCVLWEYSSPTDCTDQHRWLVALVRPRNPQNSQKFGCVSGCVGTAGYHTLLHLCKSVLSVGDPSLQEASVGSVGSVGI